MLYWPCSRILCIFLHHTLPKLNSIIKGPRGRTTLRLCLCECAISRLAKYAIAWSNVAILQYKLQKKFIAIWFVWFMNLCNEKYRFIHKQIICSLLWSTWVDQLGFLYYEFLLRCNKCIDFCKSFQRYYMNICLGQPLEQN